MSTQLDSQAAMAAIKELTELLVRPFAQPANESEKIRVEALAHLLREVIAAARPTLKATAASEITAQAPLSGGFPSPTASSPPSGIAIASAEVVLSPADRQKLRRELRPSDIPRSGYTPSAQPVFLEDYYGQSLHAPTAAAEGSRGSAMMVDAEPPELSAEARVLLGLDRPATPSQPKVEPQVSSAPLPAAASRPPSGPVSVAQPMSLLSGWETPVIVHLIAGGTLRGFIDTFEPEADAVVLLPKVEGESEQRVPLTDVLSIFFGVVRGASPTPAAGEPVVVKLVNERQVAGLTPDYGEGNAALTVIPEPRRANVDRIWIPAWAVREIILTDG